MILGRTRSVRCISFIAVIMLFSSMQVVLADTITLSTNAPTIGYGPSFPITSGGPSFTYSPASSSTITLGSTPIILNTSTENFGEYTFSASSLPADALNVTLSVTPTVNGVSATTPLVFNGTLETGLHTITQPTPYLINFDPALNPSAQTFLYGSYAIVALPFDGDLFGVDVFNGLSTPASTSSTVAPVLGFIAPASAVPEPGSTFIVGLGLALLLGLMLRARRLRAIRAHEAAARQ